MGETRYPIGEDKVVRFGGGDDIRYGCLCTFPFNYFEHKLSVRTVESLALMGAVLCMSVNGGLEKVKYADDDEYVIPDCLPRWIRDEIRRVLGDYPEKFDEGEYDTEYVSASISDEDYKSMLVERFTEIKKWAEQSIKDVENGDY